MEALQIPQEAHPQGPLKGRHSYTILSSPGARVEVQLRARLFRITKYKPDPDTKELRPINAPFKHYGGAVAAWEVVKAAAKW